MARAGGGVCGVLLRRVIPCLDVRDGRVVKGVRFSGLRDAGDPVEQATRYEAQGADELVILDVSATPEGRATAAETVARVRAALSIPLTVGGGVRAVGDAERLLDAGADKIGVNTAAVERPELIGELAARTGSQCVVVAIDAARTGDGWEVVTRSGANRTGIDAVGWASRVSELGAGEILLTSWDRDGTADGYDLGLISAIGGAVGVPVIASGGAAGAAHMVEAFGAGADAVLAASIFHDGLTTVGEIKRELRGVRGGGAVVIVPSIDLRNGNAVQLVGGREQALDAGDPRLFASRFGLVGEVAVIDLDAAMGTGDNSAVIRELLALAPCRVGGGIRDVESAVRWLDAGARKVILGTAARPEVLRELPRERVIAALDAVDGEVVTEGWTERTGVSVEDRIAELREHVGGFLLTFVEREGRMVGLPSDRIDRLVELAGPARVTVAGGVRAADDVAMADRLGADAQVGMSLYTGAMGLAEGFCAPLVSDRADGLWPTVVADGSGRAIGLVYSNLDSVREALARKRGVYFSRSRGGLWVKGETSGDTQELLGVSVDCDRDALRFTVKQNGRGFCHRGTATCFGALNGLAALDETVERRLDNAPAGSYTARLVNDEGLLRAKLVEEANELAQAGTSAHAAAEAADVIYFAMVAARSKGATLDDVERVLDERTLRVTRRKGDAKPNAAGRRQS